MNATTTPIPESVNTSQGARAWRIAKGKVCRGREVDGTYEDAPNNQLVGRLVRVGIHEGVLDDGRPYQKVECDLETAHGVQSVGCSLSSMSSSLTFAEGLLDMAKGEIVCVTANQGKKPNKFGSFTTYANLYHVDPITHKTTPATKPMFDENVGMDERLEKALTDLRTHPAYAERPKRDEDEHEVAVETTPSEFVLFCKLVAEKGWPLYGEVPRPYLDMAEKLGGAKYGSEADVPDAVWTKMREGAGKAKDVPKAVAEAKKALDDYDPFAEE